MTPFQEVVDGHWRTLEAAAPSLQRAFGTSVLPVMTTAGPLLAAIGREGDRHLLVPLGPRQSFPEDINGRAVTLRLRMLEDERSCQRFADLALVEPTLHQEFTSLCGSVLVAVEEDTGRPVQAVRRTIARWRALLAPPADLLRPEQLAGLFAELTVLGRLLNIDSSAGRAWHGPLGGIHDFRLGGKALEVKASVCIEGRRVRIHGLDQLCPPTQGELALVWFRLERGDQQGTSVVTMIDEVSEKADDPNALSATLAAAGYRPSHRGRYAETRFRVVEELQYRVDESFPRLTRDQLATGTLAAGVSEVEYTLDLDAVSTPLPQEDLIAQLVVTS